MGEVGKNASLKVYSPEKKGIWRRDPIFFPFSQMKGPP